MIGKRTVLTAVALIAAAAPAHASVVISTAATQNMTCSGGTCVPTATKAVLNASDLENDLTQFGNVRVMTTGTGVEANNIVVNAAFSSPDSTSLTLDAHKAITINAAVSIGSGTAELELQSGTLDATDVLSFGPKGHITFDSLSDIFGINGGVFTLVGSVQGLASAVAANPSGAYALANSYDAKEDGTYTTDPVSTNFTGAFEGLGNVISRLSLQTAWDEFGFFIEIGGSVHNFGLVDIDINGNGTGGGVAGSNNNGTISNCRVSGSVSSILHGFYPYVGALVGVNSGTISNSYATATVTELEKSAANNFARKPPALSRPHGERFGDIGGLVGLNYGVITGSFATGAVSVLYAKTQYSAGGLVGGNGDADDYTSGTISNSYATGSVSGVATNSVYTNFGGLIGENGYNGFASTSYSTGPVAFTSGTYDGGFVGFDESDDRLSGNYWDTETSGQSQGAGNIENDPGITGLTTQQFQSGLPSGFDPKVWAENPNINNGLPYLIANPSPK